MKYIVNAKEMQAIDATAIREIGIPSAVLMERAAMAIADAVREEVKKTDRILAVCGTGNNGGDGIAAARILSGYSYSVDIFLVGDPKKVSEETKKQIAIAENLGLTFLNKPNFCEYNGMIDALFGIGLSRNVGGIFLQVIEQINECSGHVISVDIPSGIDATTGAVLNRAVKADITVTFGFLKQGILFYPGREYAGKIVIADIGFPIQAQKRNNIADFYYEKEDLLNLPKRKADSNKGNYGKVLVAAGSKNMSGAAYLCAKAAYRIGAGLVKVLTCEENRVVLQTLLPEAIVVTYETGKQFDKAEIEQIRMELEWATAVVAGPGMGLSDTAEELVGLIIKHVTVPLVLDADALNLLAKNSDNKQNHNENSGKKYQLGKRVLMTPHKKEMARLLQQEISVISENPRQVAKDFARENAVTLVLKDAVTLVTKGEETYFNHSGNNGMATGGSGDVLAGILVGLLAQGMDDFQAAALSVYIHGLAGDMAAEEKSMYSLMASDIIEALKNVLNG